jgi:5-methylcytosine-specific restriction endonuclease McrA
MKSKLTRLKEKLDKMIQERYVPLFPKCLVCGSPTSEMHHYIQKHQSTFLRWDGRNLVPLCRKCHCKHHISGDPAIHETILKKRGFDWADELNEDRNKYFKVNIGIMEDLIRRIDEL